MGRGLKEGGEVIRREKTGVQAEGDVTPTRKVWPCPSQENDLSQKRR